MKTPIALLAVCSLSAIWATPVCAQAAGGGLAPPKLPSLKVQPKVATKRDQQAQSSYMQTMTISPEVVIEGASTQPLPALEATMLIVTMDTRAKYTQRRERYDVHARETVTIPAVDKGIQRTIEFKDSRTSFDAWRDKTNVGGAVYKYFVFGLRDPASKMILHFETNNPQLDRLVKLKPEKREEILKMPAGSEFPKDFN